MIETRNKKLLMFYVIKDHMYDLKRIYVLHFCTFYEKFYNL